MAPMVFSLNSFKHDHDDGDDKQDVRESSERVATDQSHRPWREENDCYGPTHFQIVYDERIRPSSYPPTASNRGVPILHLSFIKLVVFSTCAPADPLSGFVSCGTHVVMFTLFPSRRCIRHGGRHCCTWLYDTELAEPPTRGTPRLAKSPKPAAESHGQTKTLGPKAVATGI